MPGETVSTVHVNVLLSNLARLYRPTAFVADTLVPYIGVTHESDDYPVFDQGEFYATDVDDLVPDRATPRVIEFSHSTETYRTQRRELAWDISDRERKNADSQINLERNKQVGTLGRLMLKREIRVAALLRKVANGGQLNLGADAAAAWDTAATTSIESDIFTGREAIRTKIGGRANVIVIPEAVAAGMQKNTQLVGKLQYTYGADGSRPLLEEYYPILPPVLFGMRVMIPGELKNTANEGSAASYSDVWGESVRMLYVSPGLAKEEPSVAYTFRSEPLTTRMSREDKPRIDWFAVGQTIVEKVVAPDAGYEINNCLA
jgi:hypothetical protein